jgi:hypothetical protein
VKSARFTTCNQRFISGLATFATGQQKKTPDDVRRFPVFVLTPPRSGDGLPASFTGCTC